MTSIALKFSGQVFHGVQTDSSKFGVICLKIKVRREFFLFLIGNTLVVASFTEIKTGYRGFKTNKIRYFVCLLLAVNISHGT